MPPPASVAHEEAPIGDNAMCDYEVHACDRDGPAYAIGGTAMFWLIERVGAF